MLHTESAPAFFPWLVPRALSCPRSRPRCLIRSDCGPRHCGYLGQGAECRSISSTGLSLHFLKMYIKVSTVSTQPIKLLQNSTHLVTLRFQLTLELQNLQSTPLAQWSNLPSKVHGPPPLRHFPSTQGSRARTETPHAALWPQPSHECCVCSILFYCLALTNGQTDHI